MRPRLGIHLSLGLALDPVVANCGCGIERIGDVSLRQISDEPGLSRVIRPDAREAVGLQLGAHRRALRALRILAYLFQRPGDVLHVMTVLVREHVRLRKRTTPGSEVRSQLIEEPEIDVHVLVRWAVERSDVGARGSTTGVGRAAEEDRLRDRVVRQGAGPVLLHAVHDADDPAVLARVGVAARATADSKIGRRLHRTRSPASAQHLQQHVRDEDHEPDTSAADRDRAGRQPGRTARATAIFDLRRVETGVAPKAHDERCARLLDRVTSQRIFSKAL